MLIANDLEATVREEYRTRILGDPATIGQHILVLGPSSSGKTTAIKCFVDANPAWTYIYDPALLAIKRFSNYHHQLLIERDPHFYLAFQIEALSVRFLQNAAAGVRSICDQSLHSIWAYSRVLVQRGYLSNTSYQTFYATFLTFRSVSAWPYLVVHFTCEPSVARQRLVERGRPHELGAYSEGFLRDLSEAYSDVIKDFPDQVPVKTIDTSKMNREETVAALEVTINAYQNRHAQPRNSTVSDGSESADSNSL